MRNLSYLWLSLFCLILFSSCASQNNELVTPTVTNESSLSIAEANGFYELVSAQLSTRLSGENVMPFVLGDDATMQWDRAATSVSETLSSVDIPVRGEWNYKVLRKNIDGAYYEVNAYSKAVVVKSNVTDNLAVYIRIIIPDETYDGIYSGNISEMTLNCEDRVDYCGLEYYAAPDGIPVAVAKYADGRYVGGVYLYDRSLTERERARRFGLLFNNMWIKRCEAVTRNVVKETADDFSYGLVGDFFTDSEGNIYLYVSTNGGAYGTRANAVTQFWTAPGSGGGSGGSSGGGGIGNPGGGAGGGAGGSGIGGNGIGDIYPGAGGGGFDPMNPTSDPNIPYVSPPKPTTPIDTNPLPIHLPDADIFDPRPEVPEPPKKFPCADNVNMEINPLIDMEISNDNRSWRSNVWGYVRNGGTKFHDGLDLLGDAGVTSVFAMYSGVVVGVVSEQTHHNALGQYPIDYSGDKDGAGNRVKIETQLPDGSKIQVSYWHLDTQENNPYTKKIKIGDFISQGQIIGVIGTTGNAYGKLPHLHLKTHIIGTNKIQDKRNNPFNYIYTKFDHITGEILKDC